MLHNPKIMLLCAESSGDFLADELIDSLRDEIPNLEFTHSFVGAQCQKKGIISIEDLSVISKMGFVEILSIIPKIFRLRAAILETIAAQKPDCIICVDGFAFTHFIAKAVKKKYPHIKLVKYVAPKLWAWAPWRAYKLKIYDLILSCLPFEVDFFQQRQIPVTFVGHSVLQRIPFLSSSDKQQLRSDLGIGADKKIILLLPGSRHSEISRLGDIFIEVGQRFSPEAYQIILPTAPDKVHYFKDIPSNFTLITDPNKRFNIFQIADMALAASGTVSLELMVCSVPTIVAYKVSWLTACIARLLVRVPYVSLLNIMLNKEIFPEFLQEKCTADILYAQIQDALSRPKYLEYQKEACRQGQEMLAVQKIDSDIIPASIVSSRSIKKLIYAKF